MPLLCDLKAQALETSRTPPAPSPPTPPKLSSHSDPAAFLKRIDVLGIGIDELTFARPEQRRVDITAWLTKP